MSQCTPPHSPPTNFVGCVNNLRGYDRRGNDSALRSGHGVLYAPDGSVCAKWADGSSENPIVLPRLLEDDRAARTVVVKGGNGLVYAMKPGGNGRYVLVNESGAVFWESEGIARTTFDESTLTGYIGCDFRFAVLERCSGDGQWHLRYASREELFGVELDNNVAITGQQNCDFPIFGGKTDSAPGSWKAKPSGLAFYPLASPRNLTMPPAPGDVETIVSLANERLVNGKTVSELAGICGGRVRAHVRSRAWSYYTQYNISEHLLDFFDYQTSDYYQAVNSTAYSFDVQQSNSGADHYQLSEGHELKYRVTHNRGAGVLEASVIGVFA